MSQQHIEKLEVLAAHLNQKSQNTPYVQALEWALEQSKKAEELEKTNRKMAKNWLNATIFHFELLNEYFPTWKKHSKPEINQLLQVIHDFNSHTPTKQTEETKITNTYYIVQMNNDEFLSIDWGINCIEPATAYTTDDIDLAEKWNTKEEAMKCLEQIDANDIQNFFKEEDISFKKFMVLHTEQVLKDE